MGSAEVFPDGIYVNFFNVGALVLIFFDKTFGATCKAKATEQKARN